MTGSPNPAAMAFAAVRTSLVVLGPNNSGSTLLRNAIAASSGCWHLSREAQHIPGFPGPSTRSTGTRLIWAASADRLARVADPALHDWPRSWAAWMSAAEADDVGSSVIVMSSPPFLFLARELASALPAARFVFLVRDPLAIAGGILRRGAQQALSRGENLVEVVASHIIGCFERQRENVGCPDTEGAMLRYEDMCANPASASRRILRLVPELGKIDLAQRVAVKGLYDEPLRNMNADSIGALTADELAVLNAAFAEHGELFDFFGYGVAQ
ncbi:sulfotransferase [Citromicrobium bathyomarinum]|uniref:sulfotransferase n=1 Tax=Citromicrobium bathyomarinum TaxID=72174 RepID=UPI00315A2E97